MSESAKNSSRLASSLSPQSRARISEEFNLFVVQANGIRAAVIATIDGFEIASHRPDNTFRSQNLAAMASSLTAISKAIAKEVAFDGYQRLLLESETGKIFFQSVTSLGIPCNVCLAVSAQSMLGHTLWSLGQFVDRLRALEK